MRLLLAICLLMLGSVVTNAQRMAETREVLTAFDKKSFNALQLTLDADPETVSDLWEEFWDERYEIDIDRVDRDKGSTTYLGEQVGIPLVSEKNFDLYSKVGGTARRTLVDLAVTFSDNDAVTRSNHPRSFEAMQAMLGEFRTYFYTNYFDAQLEEARDGLGEVRDDSTDASKDAEKARKKIAKYESKIEDLQQKIEDLREEVGDEMETAEDKARRAREMEAKVREIERMRAKYLG